MTEVDWPMLELLCAAYSQYREAYDAVYHPVDPETGKRNKRTLDEYMRGRNSQTMPEYQAMKTAYQTYKSYAAEFGLSPASRNRIELPERKDEEDPMERLLNEA